MKLATVDLVALHWIAPVHTGAGLPIGPRPPGCPFATTADFEPDSLASFAARGFRAARSS